MNDQKTFQEILKEEFPSKQKFDRNIIASNSNTSSKAKGKKTNHICSVQGCGYAARIWVTYNWNIPCNISRHCPKHGDTLINVGNAEELPKKGKDREKLKQEMLSVREFNNKRK